MNSNKLINYLKNKEIYVISPHLDDAILSMGMFLYLLRNTKKTTIINAFTKAAEGPYTLSGRKFLDIAGYSNAIDLFKVREIEDRNAQKFVNTKTINLGLTEALYRTKTSKTILGKYIPEFDHIYPTYRWHLLKKVSPIDTAANDLTVRLSKLIPKNAVIFSPFGIGNHADHVITYNVCKKLFKDVIYYVDFPYNVRLSNFGKTPKGYEEFNLDVDLKIKSKLGHFYKSQINGLFPNGILPTHQEKIFLPQFLIK